MADPLNIRGPVHVVSDSKERVAYDLMIRISQSESDPTNTGQALKRDRTYWLTLYEQAYQVVSGNPATHALRDWKRPQ